MPLSVTSGFQEWGTSSEIAGSSSGMYQRFRRGKDGEQEGESENGNGKDDFLHNVLGAETEPVVSWSAVKLLRIQ